MSSHSSKVEKQNYKFGSSRFHAMSLASKKRIDVPIYPVSIEGEKILANNLENLIIWFSKYDRICTISFIESEQVLSSAQISISEIQGLTRKKLGDFCV